MGVFGPTALDIDACRELRPPVFVAGTLSRPRAVASRIGAPPPTKDSTSP